MTKPDKHERVHYIASQPFDVELQRMIDDPPMGSVPMEITPDKAAEMLKRNTRNRGYRPLFAAAMARQMVAGDWHDTGATIVFCKSGALGDGQHRLGGIVESGATIKAQIVFGAPDESFAYMDIGAKRTPGDIFTINGVENANLMAAATARLQSIRYIWPRGYTKKAPGKTAAELYDIFLEHEGLKASAKFGRAFGKNRFLEMSLATALHYVCAQKSRDAADRFFNKVATGTGILKTNEPESRLRDRLTANLGAVSKLSIRHKSALTIKAWNSSRAGLTPKSIAFDDEENFPRPR